MWPKPPIFLTASLYLPFTGGNRLSMNLRFLWFLQVFVIKWSSFFKESGKNCERDLFGDSGKE